MASTVLMNISKDEHERAKFRSRRKFETDQTSNMLTAEARGEARGEVMGESRGRKDERIKRAKALLDMLDIDVIAEKFELTSDEIEEVKKIK